jgi:hypothetical protein
VVKVPCSCSGSSCAPRHCDGAQCGSQVRPGNKTGKCRPCYLAGLGANGKKTDPQEQGKFLARMLTSAGRRARAEDPGLGVAMLLEVQAQVDQLVRSVGADVLAQYQAMADDGLTQMAEDLTLSTGQPWSKQRVFKRWGGTRPEANGG